MLEKLRRTSVIIMMGIATIIMMIALGISSFLYYRFQIDTTSQILTATLESESAHPNFFYDKQGTPHVMLAFWIDVDDNQRILRASTIADELSLNKLEDLVPSVFTTGDRHGEIQGEHISWKKAKRLYGWRLAFVHTEARDRAISMQLAINVAIFLGAILVVYIVVRLGVRATVRPVEQAWDHNRRFISDASHELKTPLSVIISNLEIMQRDGATSQQNRQWLSAALDEAKRMRQLIESLLTLAQGDEQQAAGLDQTVNFTCFDISELLHELILDLEVLAFEHGHTFESIIDDHLMVKADQTHIKQVMLILIDNAIKYADIDTPIVISLHREATRIRFTVTNQGDVIAPQDIKHIFDRFFRSDVARTQMQAGGFGLGLAIAQQIIQQHHGTIRCTSTEEEGTSFSFLL